MLQKFMQGRLGNQMFQYAAARGIHEKFDKNGEIVLVYDKSNYDGKDGRANTLTQFNLPDFVRFADECIITKEQQKVLDFLKLKKRELFETYGQEKFEMKLYEFEKEIQPTLNQCGILYFTNGYCDFNMNGDSLLFGYLECPKYFDNVTEELRKDFTTKFDKVKKNEALYDAMANSQSVCITIRRGDFVSNPANKLKHYVCTPQYFEDAIKVMEDKVPEAKYFVFSDDIDWVKNNMKFPEGSLFEDGTDSVWEKLRMMSSCKHFIISNSTFSWWAQYLADNPNKEVIAPSMWLKHSWDNSSIYQDHWTTIDPKQKDTEKEEK